MSWKDGAISTGLGTVPRGSWKNTYIYYPDPSLTLVSSLSLSALGYYTLAEVVVPCYYFSPQGDRLIVLFELFI